MVETPTKEKELLALVFQNAFVPVVKKKKVDGFCMSNLKIYFSVSLETGL